MDVHGPTAGLKSVWGTVWGTQKRPLGWSFSSIILSLLGCEWEGPWGKAPETSNCFVRVEQVLERF